VSFRERERTRERRKGGRDSLALSGDRPLENEVGLVRLTLKDVQTRLEEDWSGEEQGRYQRRVSKGNEGRGRTDA